MSSTLTGDVCVIPLHKCYIRDVADSGLLCGVAFLSICPTHTKTLH